MPPQPLSPTHGSTHHSPVAAVSSHPGPPSSASSSSSHTSLQQRLRQALLRTSSSRSQDLLDTGLRHRSSAQLPLQGSGPPPRQNLARANTAPMGPPKMSPWPLADQDEQHLNQFKERIRVFDSSLSKDGPLARPQSFEALVAHRQAFAALTFYQNYLRTRMVQVSEDLREFKERHKAVIATLFGPEETKMWQMLNGTEVLIKGIDQNPFKEAEVIEFLAAQMAREDNLDHVIQEKIVDIRRAHGERISAVRCRELLVLRAHKELVEKDYIQFYLEMTMLSRCQITAIREHQRLASFAKSQG